MICPICNNKELKPTDAFCPTCGYEIHVYPRGVSDSVREYEKTRKENYIKIWREQKNSHNSILKYEKKCNEIQKQLDRKLKECEKMCVQNKELAANLSSAQYDINYLNTQLEVKQKSINQLEYKINNYRDKEVVGIVSVKNLKSESIQYIPVYKGVNTFGAAADNNNHHEIKIRNQGGILMPMHFSVIIDRQVRVKPIDNAELINYGIPLPAEGIYVAAQQGIFIANVLEIHVSKL